jgi:trigger factor
MKAVKEALSPTRVKLTIEVPFDELKPSLDAAYKKIGAQVRVQGFRPGKVPPRILDQRVGRGTIISEAIEDAVPRFYSTAVTEQEVDILGRPDVDISSFGDGEPLVFTAEVDIRPDVELPDYDGLPVTVDDADATDEEIDEQLSGMRERFAVLEGVDRPVATGDFVSIDLEASAGGEPVEGANTTGLSYEVGSETLVPGLDEQLVGLVDGGSATFTTQLVAGDHAGKDADVTVTVRSVKSKVLPELDDEFATTASEFDTLAELTEDLRSRISRVKRLQQGMQARDKALEALLERVEVPLPEAAVSAEVDGRMHNLGHQLENAGLSLEGYLADEEKSREDFDAEVRASAEQAVKASLVLDAIARKEELGVNDAELTDQVVRRAQRAGISPQSYADQLVQAGQIPVLAGEIVRGKALALVLEGAAVTDESGNVVDIKALSAELDGRPAGEDELADHEGHDHEGHDHAGHDHEGHDHEGHDHAGHDHDADTSDPTDVLPEGPQDV